MLKDVTCSYIKMLPRMWVGCYSMSLSVYSSDPMWLHLLELWQMLLSASRAGFTPAVTVLRIVVWTFPLEGILADRLSVRKVLAIFRSGFNKTCPRRSELTTQMRVAPFRWPPGSSLMIAVLLPSCDIILGLKNWFLWPPLFLVLLVILLPCWFT